MKDRTDGEKKEGTKEGRKIKLLGAEKNKQAWVESKTLFSEEQSTTQKVSC